MSVIRRVGAARNQSRALQTSSWGPDRGAPDAVRRGTTRIPRLTGCCVFGLEAEEAREEALLLGLGLLLLFLAALLEALTLVLFVSGFFALGGQVGGVAGVVNRLHVLGDFLFGVLALCLVSLGLLGVLLCRCLLGGSLVSFNVLLVLGTNRGVGVDAGLLGLVLLDGLFRRGGLSLGDGCLVLLVSFGGGCRVGVSWAL